MQLPFGAVAAGQRKIDALLVVAQGLLGLLAFFQGGIHLFRVNVHPARGEQDKPVDDQHQSHHQLLGGQSKAVNTFLGRALHDVQRVVR